MLTKQRSFSVPSEQLLRKPSNVSVATSEEYADELRDVFPNTPPLSVRNNKIRYNAACKF